jgi:hypothetical protein
VSVIVLLHDRAMATKLRVGDVFSLSIAKGEQVFGRVLLDVQEQCIKPKRILTSSPLTFFKQAHLVEVTRDEGGAQIIVPGTFVHAVELSKVGHRAVDPTKVEFPWALSLYGPRPHFYWGELRIPVSLPIPQYRAIEISPRLSPVNTLIPRSLYRMGRRDEIDRSTYRDIELFSPAADDLKESPHRARIEALVADRVLTDYYSTAAAYGYDLQRLYSAEAGQRELLLCTYCTASITADARACSVCAEPTGRDALVSKTVDELALADRKPCKVCAAPILKIATICRWCRSRQ